jgi:hypothetical protein
MPKQLNPGLSHEDIQTLVEKMENGQVVLPDFQRDFVWPTKQVAKLLESILNGYYINTLLTLPVTSGEDGAPFPPRLADGVPESSTKAMNMEMILDGQQRLTSIYYAVTAPEINLDNTKYPQLFYLEFSKVIEGDTSMDAIDWRRGYWEDSSEWEKSKRWDSSQELVSNDFELQLEKDKVPFTVFKSKQSFKEWRRGMKEHVKDRDDYTREDVDKFDDNTEVFRNYRVPIIQLNPSTSDSKVVQTFERINTQGLELGVFDILTARLYTHDIKLRDLWEETVSKYHNIEEFSNRNGKEKARKHILDTLAISRDKEPKDSNLRKLDPENFDKDWKEVSRKFEKALERVYSANEGGFGATERFGTPYGAMLPTLANLIDIGLNQDKIPNKKALDRIKRWYWISVFSQRYSGSSNTISYRDYKEIQDWIGETETPEAVEEAHNTLPLLNLEDLTRGASYKAVMSLLVLNDARDFNSFESINLHKVDDHHIFPKSRLEEGLKGEEYGEIERNTILNRTIIESKGNRFKYGNDLPSEYVAKMIEEHGRKEVEKLMADHFINEDGLEALLNDDYEGFLEARRTEIRSAVEERTGLDVNWNIEENS